MIFLFWNATQRKLVIVYGHFGTAYRSHLQGSKGPRRVLRGPRNIPEERINTYKRSCVVMCR
jgi:hypothetical protein